MKIHDGFFNYSFDKENKRIIIHDWEKFVKYHKQFDDTEFAMATKPVSNYSEKERMYAYYHKVVLSACSIGLTEQGYEDVDKVFADYYLKSQCAKAKKYNSITDTEEIYLEDKHTMGKDKLREYIDKCIQHIESTFEVEVPDSRVWKANTTGYKSLKEMFKKV